MGQDDEMLKNKVKNQTTSKVAEKTATVVGGPIAGAAVKGLNKTKTGQAVLSKGAEKIGKNPMTAKQMNSRNQMGASNAPSSGSETSNPNGAPTTSGSAPSTSSDVPNSSMNLGDRLKGAGASALANSVNSESKTGQALNTANDVKTTVENIKKIKKIAIIGGPFIGYFLIILICIAGIIGFILGPADTVIQFFRDGWENLKTLVGYKDDEQWELEYYKKLDEVQEAYNQKFGVCIDINLITATLTVDVGTDDYLKVGQQKEEDTPDGSELGLSGDDYKKMIKQIELLGNMQIKRKVYGLDKKQAEKNETSRVHEKTREGIPVEFVSNGDDYCRNEDEELSEYAIMSDEDPYASIGIDERKDDFNLSDAKFLSGLQNQILQAMSGLNGTPVRDSRTAREVASNDIEPGIFKFLNKKANEERNIEYKFYIPTYTYNEIYDNGKLIKYEKTCEKELPKDDNSKDFAQLDIGELNDMENNVYYWNLMDSFIADYYADYLPPADGPLDVEDPRYKKIKKIVEDIYLLYNEMGPNRECQAVYKKECSYFVDDVTDKDGNLSIETNYDNVKVQLLECKKSEYHPEGVIENINSITFPELMDLEEYIMGVTSTEISGADTNEQKVRNYEAVKAQAIAARSYALTYPDDKKVMDDGTLVIYIQNCTNKQVYSTSNLQILKSDQNWVNALEEVQGMILTDANGNIITAGYNSTIQKKWMSEVGMSYTEMLMDTYSDAQIISSNCRTIGNIRGKYTGEGKIINNGNECYSKNNNPEYWSKFNGGGCTEWAYGRAVKILVESRGFTMENAKKALDSFLVPDGSRSDGNAWAWKNDKYKAFDGIYWDRDDINATPNYDSKEFQDSIKEGAIVSWSGGSSCCGDNGRAYGHVGIVEKVERDSEGNITKIVTSEGGVKNGGYNGCIIKSYNSLKDFYNPLAKNGIKRWVNGFVYLLS